MNVLKATPEAVSAIRKMSEIRRDLTGGTLRKNIGYASSNNRYAGPFCANWDGSSQTTLTIEDPTGLSPEGKAGCIFTPEGVMIGSVPTGTITISESNPLVALVVRINGYESIQCSYQAVPDPRQGNIFSQYDLINAVNPVTAAYPLRNPKIAVYQIAVVKNGLLFQIQKGDIIDASRWWYL